MWLSFHIHRQCLEIIWSLMLWSPSLWSPGTSDPESHDELEFSVTSVSPLARQKGWCYCLCFFSQLCFHWN